jgi:rhomboid protease GluP
MCPHCRAFITTKDRVCPYCNENVGPRAVDLRSAGEVIGGFIPHARFNTMMILVVNFGLYLATAVYAMKIGKGSLMSPGGEVLLNFGSKVGLGYLMGPSEVYGQWWRLVTAGFLHGNLLHIAMNSWVLFDLGAQVEEVYGASRMWVIYFLSSCAGFLASAWWNPSISIGASAGLCGLIGAMIALGMRHRNPMGDAIRGMYIRWAIYTIIMGFIIPFVDNAAHIGGLAGGFAVAYISQTPGRYPAVETLWRAAAFFCILLTLVSFLKWWLWFSHLDRMI